MRLISSCYTSVFMKLQSHHPNFGAEIFKPFANSVSALCILERPSDSCVFNLRTSLVCRGHRGLRTECEVQHLFHLTNPRRSAIRRRFPIPERCVDAYALEHVQVSPYYVCGPQALRLAYVASGRDRRQRKILRGARPDTCAC